MPNQNATPNSYSIAEDEIDLRELFRTIGRYKWSIMLITFLITAITAVIAYRMPKYYKTTTVIEVKPENGKGPSFSLSGAGALLGLSGDGDGGSSIDKDAALMSMYRVSDKVLDGVSYSVQYYIYEKYRYTELPDNNCSISISNLHIPDFKKFGMKVGFEAISKEKFKLTATSSLFDQILGKYNYGEPVHTEYFDLTVHRTSQGAIPSQIILNANKRYIFDKVISKNFSAQVDKNNPFISISYLDTIPDRGERYIKSLIENYIQLSVGFEIEDANIGLDSLNKQISEIESKVLTNADIMEKFKSKKLILSPQAQAQVLIKGKAVTDDQLIQNSYQRDLIKQLISFVNKNRNIDAIAPSLAELKDRPTTALITKLQSLQLEATSLAQEFKPAYPKLKSIRSQIRSIKSKIKSNLKNLQKTLHARAKSLKKLKSEYDRKLRVAPTAEKEMTNILRDYKLNEKLYAYLLQKRSSAQIKKAEAMSRFRIIESIYTNQAPAKPKKALIVIVGFITALFLSIFLAFFREFLRKEK